MSPALCLSIAAWTAGGSALLILVAAIILRAGIALGTLRTATLAGVAALFGIGIWGFLAACTFVVGAGISAFIGSL